MVAFVALPAPLFEDVIASHLDPVTGGVSTMGATLIDVYGDGLSDLYLANRRSPNALVFGRARE